MPPPPWFGGGDHLCPYGRKLIGSLVPVHSRSVRSNTYAFLDPSLKLVAFLLNYFTCLPIQNMIVLTDVVCYGCYGLFKASDTFNVFQVLIFKRWLTVIETVNINKTLRLAMF